MMADWSTLRDRILSEPAGAHFPAEVTLLKAVELTFLPGNVMTLSFEPDHVARQKVVDCIEQLDRISLADRVAFEERLWAFYCREMEDGAGNYDTPQEQLDWEADFNQRRTFPNPVHATKPEEVWPLIRIDQLAISRLDTGVQAWLHGPAAWDSEHGIAFRFDDQGNLLTVGSR